jgi:elongation factor G
MRNVVLLSHSGAGKTSLTEAALFATKAITRLGRVDEGTTTSDYEPEEIKRHISISLSPVPCHWQGTKINLIDTPGYLDFLGEVVAGMRVAEAALVVVCAASGVEVGTELVWGYAEEAKLPRLIIVNKMDRENADFFRTLEQIQASFGKRCLPLQLPIGAQDNFRGIIDLIQRQAHDSDPGAAIPQSMEDQVDSFRERLVEAAAEQADDLVTKYLEGEALSPEEIGRGLKLGILSGKIVPVLAGSALKGIGISQLLGAVVDYLPSPQDMGAVKVVTPDGRVEEVKPSPGEPLAAVVFKTSADPYVGKLTCFRVYSGSIYSNSQVFNATRGQVERIGQLMLLRGKMQEPVSELVAGDIGAVAKLSVTATGDTLSSKERPWLLPAPRFPPPIYRKAIHPKTKADLDKLGSALLRLAEEDPTLQVVRDPDTGETVLCGLGDAHLEITAEKLQRKFGVEVILSLPKVAYKETISVPVKAEYKHKKQTGGHGQYGHVFLELEPLPRGSGVEFGERIVGGTVPKNYIPAVEKGVYEAAQEGVLARYPVTDVRATLYDGSYHVVDSSDISFKIAGAQAFKKGLSQGQPVLLEPIMKLKVIVPEGFTGDIMSDLNAKQARVQGMYPEGAFNVIEAEVLNYAIDLRSLTQGRGRYTMEFSHYEEVPAHLAQRIMESREKERS